MPDFVRELERMIRGCTIEWDDAQRMHDLIRLVTRPQRIANQFMGIDQGVAGSDRTVYYRKNNDGTYTELDGNIDLGQNSSVDESAVQSCHYPTYGGQIRSKEPKMKDPNYTPSFDSLARRHPNTGRSSTGS